MNKNNLYVDFHVLQTVPPSNVNRDDMGSPKTAVYGGATRARVSSQSWKRAMRVAFRDIFPQEQLGERTKRIVEKVREKIQETDAQVDASKLATEALKNAGLKIKSEDKGTDALFFMSSSQAAALAKLAVSGEKDVKQYKEALKEIPSVDMALFGRMVADDPSLNYDAAAQVAHCISTHSVQNEFDYFTAVDDRGAEDNAGAGHLGTVEYNSSTLYRYATLNIRELEKTIKEETPAVVRGFAEAFICSMPTGKQNSFANRTVPALVYVTIRRDQPVNLVGAFEEPIRAKAGGYEAASEEELVKYAKSCYELFAEKPEKAFGISRRNYLQEIAPIVSLPNLLLQLEQAVAERLEEKG